MMQLGDNADISEEICDDLEAYVCVLTNINVLR